MRDRTGPILLMVAFGAMLGFVAFLLVGPRDASGDTIAAPDGTPTTVPGGDGGTNPTDATGSTTNGGSTPSTTTGPGGQTRDPDTVPGWTVGQSWGDTVGLTMFRGNPTRTYYGTGPVSDNPSQLWSYPSNGMCSQSTNLGETTTWCGMGWTGQPAVWERPDGVTEMIFGAYDRNIHFVDAETGVDLRSPFTTGDIIKGSVTIDPDGFPLLYTGSRDNYLRIIALDRDEPTELWSLHAEAVDGTWNDDWDSNPVIIDDIMYEGGENGWFFAYELNRGYDANGNVTVEPRNLLSMPSYDSQLLSDAGPNVSVENSAVAFDDRVYFNNSVGRVIGLDVSDIRNGNAPIVFDFYAGGDGDASMIVDEEGMLYVSTNVKPGQVSSGYRTSGNISRSMELGQLIKLDPYADGDPVIWGVDLVEGATGDSGTWATPALHDGYLYTNIHNGSLVVVDATSGEIVWRDGSVGWHSWSSPVIVDDTLVVATCAGDVRGYDLANPAGPERTWTVSLGETCLEATPAVWNGTVYIGSRDGYLRALR
ncbi:MAG TPA: PQQ-binding-like beta-propeller repeat protein [Acidimicrobiia bacterium]|nr:PQQ-binding-like beta-propeller repeat protein [Acidimicrobiia bacterium]